LIRLKMTLVLEDVLIWIECMNIRA